MPQQEDLQLNKTTPRPHPPKSQLVFICGRQELRKGGERESGSGSESESEREGTVLTSRGEPKTRLCCRGRW